MRRTISVVLLTVCLVTAGAAPALAAPTAGTGASDAVAPDARDVDGGTAVAQTATNDTTGNATEITVIGYNDIGSAVTGGDEDRLGRMITLVDERRAASSGPTFVAGAGDELSPHALRGANYSRIEGVSAGWEPPVRALNLIDPDAEAVQNHELDYDEDRGVTNFSVFANASRASNFPWLAANVVYGDTRAGLPGTQNYTVVERDGVRVGYFGVVDEAINAKTDGVVERNGYRVLDPTTVAQRTTTTLREEENVDVVVALTPIGIDGSKDLANETEGIDVMIAGDDQRRYPPRTTDGVVITETTGTANAIAEVNLTVENGSVTAAEGRLINVTSNTTRNAEWASYIDPVVDSYLNVTFGGSEVALDARANVNYHEETTTGNLITDGVRSYTDADVAITNAGGIRSNTVYPPGPVTRGEINSILAFGNGVVKVRVTGAELRDVLASQLAPVGSSSAAQYGPQIQQQVSGVRFEWYPHADVPDPQVGDGQLREIYVGGEPLNDSANYTVAVNSYIADGGSGYPLADEPRVGSYNLTMAEAVLEYVERRGSLTEEELDPAVQSRMRRVNRDVETVAVRPGNDTVTVVVESPSQLDSYSQTFVLRDWSDDEPHPEVATAESVTATNGTERLAVEFDASDYDRVVDADDENVDLYGRYNDTEYADDFLYFDRAVLNADVAGQVNDGTGPGEAPVVARRAAGDVDGDGLYEDVNGDGELTLSDVTLLFVNLENAAVTENAAAFDFSDDGGVGVGDVTALFDELVG
jgi:2',3'-cyclic-nucleotide 2'-phosphodiesterase (5'-nucleotidase family)